MMRIDRESKSANRRRLSIRRSAAAVFGAGLLASACTPAASTATTTRADTARVPTLNWQPCDSGFQCATARVPLDYRHPDGAKISIAVARHPATDHAHRLGSLFINAGGPNAQVDNLKATYAGLPAALRARYAIIGFDPRGFGHSTAVRCFPTMAAEQSYFSGLSDFPVSAQEIATWDQTWARFDALCAKRNGSLLKHVSTADTARDMDLLRQAIGDSLLNYFSVSYGTGLGAIYANLFPNRVGHMVLDGNLDPVAWTTGKSDLPMYLRDREDEASAATLRAFLDLCGKASTSACAFSAGTPAATRAKFNTLLSRLRRHPVPRPDSSSQTSACGYACAVDIVPLARVRAWPSGASTLQQLWVASTTGSTASPSAGTQNAAPSTVYAGAEQGRAVVCSDGPHPRDLRAYTAGARLAYARSGPVGPKWVWGTEMCAHWPKSQDGYSGPWNRPTANPILVIGNTGDPDTPYWNSQAMARDLAHARLLTVDGYGHTEVGNPSTCARKYELDDLVTGALPPAGTVCQQDTKPFA